MSTIEIAIRRSGAQDAPALAALHREAWLYAYRGIIPGLVLERMLARRGAGWWWQAHATGGTVLLLEFDGAPAGYATYGRGRRARPGARGEIHELYLDPRYHGAGLGRRLFAAARAELAVAGLAGLVVHALAANHDACRFYRAMGGREIARGSVRIGGVRLPTITFHWR